MYELFPFQQFCRPSTLTKTGSRTSMSSMQSGSMSGSIGGPVAPASPTSEERPGLPDLPPSTSPQPRRDSQGKPRRYSLQPQRHIY